MDIILDRWDAERLAARRAEGLVLVKASSHRARNRMVMRIGGRSPHFSWDRAGEFYWLTPKDAERVLDIPGISKAREGTDIRPCLEL
jgi:hypothetical protein